MISYQVLFVIEAVSNSHDAVGNIDNTVICTTLHCLSMKSRVLGKIGIQSKSS